MYSWNGRELCDDAEHYCKHVGIDCQKYYIIYANFKIKLSKKRKISRKSNMVELEVDI